MDLELTCPSCEQILMLDAGFAGGVCRCSSCGTLMTVPQVAQPDLVPTKKVRPDTPDHTPQTTTSAATKPAYNTNSLPTHPSPSSTHTTTQHATSPDKSASRTAQADVIATRSRLNRRFAIRIGIISAFIALSSIAVFAVSILYHYQTSLLAEMRKQPDLIVEFAYDPEANPFRLDKPNFLGLQLSPKSVIVVDTPMTSSRWLGLVKEAIITGTDFNTNIIAIQLVFTNPNQPTVFPEDFTPLNDLRHNELRRYLNSNLAMGSTDPVNALRLALVLEPVQLVFVIGQNLSSQHVRAIRTMMQNKPSTRFDCFLIGTQNNDLKKLATDHNGQTITLTAQQLSNLRYDTP